LNAAVPNSLPSKIVKSDEAVLVSAAKNGDTSAFEELVNRYERKIFRIAKNITGNQVDAEDAMQDAFLKAYTHLGEFQGDSRFYTWLVRIAANESLMRLRKRRPNHFSLDEPLEHEGDLMPRDLEEWRPNPEQQYSKSELKEIVDEMIESLPPEFRVVVLLRDIEELSTEDTAATLGISVSAVKSRLLRARLKLREKLDRHFRGGRLN
jgi:RNA polymerase sigma-70 factor, ECF subfamily